MSVCEESPSESLPPLEARVSAVFVVMVASWAGVILPLFASKCGHGPGIVVLKCGSLFGAGVLLATALVHMLFPAMENLTHPCLSAFFTEDYPALAMAVVLATILGMHVLHVFIGRHMHSVHNQRHGIEATRSETNSDSSKSYDEYSFEHSAYSSTQGDAMSMIDTLPSSDSHDVHEAAIDLLLVDQHVSTIILEVGVALHSIIIGFVVGVARDEFFTLFIALSVHQFFEGVALSSTVLHNQFRARVVAVFAIVYGLTTPFGVALGLAVGSRFDSTTEPSFLVPVGLLDAIAAGLLLYDGLVNVLLPGFGDRFAHEASRITLFLFLCSVWLGATLLALLGIWI